MKWLIKLAENLCGSTQVKSQAKRMRVKNGDVWARPNMRLVMRAELMPGRGRSERVCRVKRVLPSNRVTLCGIAGEHDASEFEL